MTSSSATPAKTRSARGAQLLPGPSGRVGVAAEQFRQAVVGDVGRGLRRIGSGVGTELVSRLGPYALVAMVVVAASSLYAFGAFDPNPLISMSGLAVVVKGGVLAGRFTIDPNAGTTAQSLGHLAALDLLHGKIPWWNPYEGVGAPLAGEMQSAALFPPTLLLALPSGQLLFHMLLEAVTGMATYRLLARVGVSRWIAAGGGSAFALNGTYAWFMHAPVNPIAFLPLLLLGAERARVAAEEGRAGSFGLVAVALALSVYAGFPEVAYLDGIFAVVWSALRARGLGRRALLGYARKLVAGVVVGALLAAPLLVAFGDYLPAAYLGPHAGGYDALSVPGSGVGALFFPYVAGPIFGFTPAEASGVLGSFWIDVGGYLTTTLLVLGVVALWGRRLRVLRLGLAAWVVVALGRTYGIGPFERLFDVLPLMNHVEVYRYLTPSIELACVVLACLAVDDLRRADVPSWCLGAAVVVAAGCALWTLEAGRRLLGAVGSVSESHAWILGSLAWGFGIAAVVGAAGLLLRGRLRGLVLTGLVVLDACAMFVVPELSAPRGGKIDTALVRWAETHGRTGRLFTLGGVLNPNFGSYLQVEEADVNDLPMPKSYARFIVRRLDPSTIPNHFDGTTIVVPAGGARDETETPVRALAGSLGWYEAIGVRDVVVYTGSQDAASLSALGLRRVFADRHAEVYRLPRAAPMYSAQAAGSEASPRPPASPASGSSAASGSGRTRRAVCVLSDQQVDSVNVDCRRAAVLVRRELWMAGWSATGDGHALEVRRDGVLFQSVLLGRGRTVVRFSFVPPHEGVALWALAAGLVALAAGWGLGSRLGSRASSRRPWHQRRERRWHQRPSASSSSR